MAAGRGLFVQATPTPTSADAGPALPRCCRSIYMVPLLVLWYTIASCLFLAALFRLASSPPLLLLLLRELLIRVADRL